MRILIIWAESINRYSGGTMHLMGWCYGLGALGHEVKVVAPCYGRGKKSLIENASYIRLPRRCLMSFVLLQIAIVFCLPYWILRYRPEAICVRACFLAFLMACICKLAGIPIIVEAGTIVDEEMSMRGESRLLAILVRFFERLNYRWINGLVCVTDGAREEYIRRGANPDTTVVIHNAAQTDIMRPMDQKCARRQLGLAEEDYIVGFAGTLAPWQGLDLLVRAAKEVVDNSGRSVKFLLVGEGQCQEQLEEMVDQLDLGQSFSFLAPMPYEQVAVFNNACDVVVIPIYDPRKLRYGIDPLKFWEALAVGVPVLLPEGCQLDDILEQLGLPGTFRPGDNKHLAETILEVLAQTEHHQARREDVHRIVSEQYSWTHVAEKLAEHCRRLRRKTQ
ncbi:MAG: glycosyltransferase family 4 protein [Planctomycetes bacterium]|nr:glycosyltransferase family 4 protein [Planctomycetota bacterium]